jgi:hypothetical protein
MANITLARPSTRTRTSARNRLGTIYTSRLTTDPQLS